MTDRNVFIASILFILLFLVTGILDILDNPVTMIVLITSFLVILANIIYAKTRDNTK
ncbi:MAG: hypothetical protein KJO49_02265 [Bacteroidia bacterium]|nr:hypothetical protein [Bacteroidia bacterium]NNK71516.1 hypothetical protein [Flavobacteriaceae bacterium]